MVKKASNVSPLLNSIMESSGLNVEQPKQKWEDLENLFSDIAHGIISIATEVNNSVQVINTVEGVDVSEVTAAVNGLSRDLESFSDDLSKVHDEHKGKTGIISEDDVTDCLNIFNSYVIINDKFRSLVFSPMLVITEKMMEVQEKLKNKNATNVNVVTDVTPKETTNV